MVRWADGRFAFRVTINGKHFATAGVPDTHVLSVIIGSVVRTNRVLKRLPPKDRRAAKRILDFYLGGCLSREDGSGVSLEWGRLDLKPGDSIQIDVIESDQVDPPKKRRPYKAQPESVEAAGRGKSSQKQTSVKPKSRTPALPKQRKRQTVQRS